MSTFRTSQGKPVIRMDILPPDASGRVQRTRRPRGEVVDAQFVTIGDVSRRAHRPSHNDNRRRPFTTAGVKKSFLERMLAAGERALMRLSADFFSAVVAMVFVLVFTVAGGFSFLFSGTQTADVGQALDITHVTMTPQDANGMRVLLINGIVENRSDARLSMPAIRADLLAGEELLTTTLITPPVAAIAGRQSHGFSARVPQPGGKLPDLRLSFTERGA
ncbi:hypothetical protein [Rhizobium terrae]|uniref:hypothetical protein n=1 Tax=Rhizobium terrae TaxID=2171756 RepID=UPI000E3CCD48|nr:hypothetical protein [Rhizobium terrae]